VLTTHLIEDLKYVADSVAVLVGGSLRYTGTFDDFARHVPEGRASRFGDTFENAYRALTTDAPMRRMSRR
jgi:ABC-type multidrug transport system ATPase subunit